MLYEGKYEKNIIFIICIFVPENVSGWAKDSVLWALGAGIILPEEIAAPQEGSTRALVAQMLYRLGGNS